jgi:hypothetical protein
LVALLFAVEFWFPQVIAVILEVFLDRLHYLLCECAPVERGVFIDFFGKVRWDPGLFEVGFVDWHVSTVAKGGAPVNGLF